MAENIFEKIHERKQKILAYVQLAKENQIISDEEFASIKNKIDDDKLTLGVIGQMKCGKSTFLNSLIFGDDSGHVYSLNINKYEVPGSTQMFYSIAVLIIVIIIVAVVVFKIKGRK